MKEIHLLDNYDSFTYNLQHYFQKLGVKCTVVRNDEWSLNRWQDELKDGLVISPGPNTPSEAGISLELLGAVRNKLPILGVCLGHQAIGQLYGEEIHLAHKPMHGKQSEIIVEDDPLFDGLDLPIMVMRYHSLIVNLKPKSDLKILAKTKDGELMAMKHEKEKMYGIQFHPESIGTPQGLRILQNWLELNSPNHS